VKKIKRIEVRPILIVILLFIPLATVDNIKADDTKTRGPAFDFEINTDSDNFYMDASPNATKAIKFAIWVNNTGRSPETISFNYELSESGTVTFDNVGLIRPGEVVLVTALVTIQFADTHLQYATVTVFATCDQNPSMRKELEVTIYLYRANSYHIGSEETYLTVKAGKGEEYELTIGNSGNSEEYFEIEVENYEFLNKNGIVTTIEKSMFMVAPEKSRTITIRCDTQTYTATKKFEIAILVRSVTAEEFGLEQIPQRIVLVLRVEPSTDTIITSWGPVILILIIFFVVLVGSRVAYKRLKLRDHRRQNPGSVEEMEPPTSSTSR